MSNLQQDPWATLSGYDSAAAAIAHFKSQLPADQIPSLDAVSPLDLHRYVGQVVRWSLLVQDTTLGREVFSQRTKHNKSLLFREALFQAEAQENDEPDFNALGERNCVFCVSQRAFNASPPALEENLAQLNVTESIKAHPKIVQKFPTRDPTASGVLVKSYLDEDLKAADFFEFVGVLDAAHFLPAMAEDEADAIPCHSLHVLWQQPAKTGPSAGAAPKTPANWAVCKPALLAHLASLLNGDQLAAEYTIFSLLSRIHTRKDSLMLGHFPINLRLHPSVDVARLSTFLQSLVSPSLTLSMSISSLNDRNMLFAPEAHEESLHAGRLQLPTSALVVVDETAMDEGKLESHGLKNLNALAKALGQAKLDYIFPFSQFSFDVDLNFIVLSTSKSLLPVPHVVPIKSQKGEAVGEPSPEDLRLWRECLQGIKFVDFSLNDEAVVKHIEQSFVDMRQRDGKIGHDDLMRLMTLARLVALSNGASSMTTEAFDEARQLDETRLSRLSSS